MIPEFSETLLFLPLLETSFLGITTSLGMEATHFRGINVEQVFFMSYMFNVSCIEQFSIFYSSHLNSSII